MHIHGFTLVREEKVHELSSTARLWRHDATGGELLSFVNADENKVFGVSFRTPPADSTGVAHILEHSVLCGSEKYPVKEPFVELLKGSLQTFLNAFTYPDKTCYPVASANLKDFYNLTDVYLDAVFFPRITKDIFRQEGWHLEPGDAPGSLQYKGVVYNEMKGAFSSPESVLGRYSLHSLFPDTIYGLESGGDPMDIPKLTYEDFYDFHRRYYHPSNARFYFWGDNPEEARLEKLNETLSRFQALKVDSSVGLQTPLAQPETVRVPYAASEAEGKGMVTLNWLGPDVMDVESTLALRMLEYMLLGMPASPLRRALIESGLGEDLAGQGLETELRQLTFDAGLKGIDVQKAGDVERLILDTLSSLAEEGLSDELVEAAVNSVEFALRENNSGRFPVGLSVMLRSLTTWLHGGDPLASLAFEGPLASIKAKAATRNGYFEGLITRWLVDNAHRITVILTPDSTLAARQEQEEAARLEDLAKGMDAQALKAVSAQAEALNAWQATPDTAEALATIPRLHVADLPRENGLIPTSYTQEDIPVYFHGLPTGGIVYAEAGFALDGINPEHVPLLPLFGRALLEMGTTDKSFAELGMTISRKTGGIGADTLLLTSARDRSAVTRLVLEGKVTPDKLAELFGLMEEVLCKATFDDKARFLQMVLEEKARQEHGLVPSGHMVVATRLRAALSPTGLLAEQTGGVSYLEYLRGLARQAEENWPAVLSSLEALRDTIIARSRLEMNITALPEQQAETSDRAKALAVALPQGSRGDAAWRPMAFSPAEALILPAQVNYIGKGINLFDAGYAWHGSALVILKFLRTGYLWDRVRVQGGAYGCMCGLDRMNGSFFMVSYRDPNVLSTLEVYDKTAAYLQKHSLSAEELNAAIVGAIGELDTYLLPDAKGSTAYARILSHDAEENRQRMRDEVLGTTPAHFKAFGQALELFSSRGHICGLGGNALERTAKDSGWLCTRVL